MQSIFVMSAANFRCRKGRWSSSRRTATSVVDRKAPDAVGLWTVGMTDMQHWHNADQDPGDRAWTCAAARCSLAACPWLVGQGNPVRASKPVAAGARVPSGRRAIPQYATGRGSSLVASLAAWVLLSGSAATVGRQTGRGSHRCLAEESRAGRWVTGSRSWSAPAKGA
jgi:hypothetical protein